MNDKLKKLSNWFIVAAFALIIFAIPLLTKMEQVQSISLFENRSLATAPTFSRENLLSGAYFSGWESYFQDHIFKRNGWLLANVIYEEKFLGRQVVNDVVILDNLLLPKITYRTPTKNLDEKVLATTQNLKKITSLLGQWGGKFVYIGMPEQYSAFRDEYPSYIFNNEQNLADAERAFFNSLAAHNVDYINMREAFLANGNIGNYYLKTDHHYNFCGAHLAYITLCNKLRGQGLDIPITTSDKLEFIELSNSFLGSRGRKLYGQTKVVDQLTIYELHQSIPFSRQDNGSPVKSQVFTMPTSAAADVEYTIYMGGDIAETIITTNRPELPNILIFGDSFTNPLETLIYTSFNETRSLDLRYYQEKGILQYIAEYRPDVVICVRDDNYYLTNEGNGCIE